MLKMGSYWVIIYAPIDLCDIQVIIDSTCVWYSSVNLNFYDLFWWFQCSYLIGLNYIFCSSSFSMIPLQ